MRGFVPRNNPTLNKRRWARTMATIAIERDLAKENKAIERHAATKTAAVERERTWRKFEAIATAPRRGLAVIKAQGKATRRNRKVNASV